MSYTMTQFAYQAARDLGVMRPAQSLSPDTLNDILVAGNEWLDGQNLNRDFVYALQDQTFNLTGSQQTYTIGPAETAPNFTAPRPTFIEAAAILLNTVSPVVRVSIGVIHVKERSAIPVDIIPSAIPNKLYYDYGLSATGAGTIFLWPGPLTSYQLELWAWPGSTYQIQQFADLVTPYSFPPGYARWIRKALGVEIAPMLRILSKLPKEEYDKNVASIAVQMREAKALVESFNAPEALIGTDPAFLSSGKRYGWSYGIGDYST